MATAPPDDPLLGVGPDEEASEISLSGSESDSGSVLSDDSVLPDYKQATTANGLAASTLYAACARNQAYSLRKILERGITKEEAMAVDINGWVNGFL